MLAVDVVDAGQAAQSLPGTVLLQAHHYDGLARMGEAALAGACGHLCGGSLHGSLIFY